MECCKNSRMKATARVTRRIQQKPFDFIIMSTMKKHKLELYAKLPVKQKLSVDEHPPTKSLVLNTSLEYTQVFVFPAFCLQVQPLLLSSRAAAQCSHCSAQTHFMFRTALFKDFGFKV